MAKRDYYDVLGLPRTASADEVKAAYRKLARQYHPDVNTGDRKVAEEKFKEVSEAYEVLADEEKRRRYDSVGFSGVETDFGPGGFTWQNFTHAGDLEDLLGGTSFFQQLFQQGLFGVPGGRRRMSRGGDLEVTVRLPLAAAVEGAAPTLDVPFAGRCDSCRGTGAKDGTALEVCPECEGRGQVRRAQTRGISQLITISECPMCHGSGRRIKVACPVCDGTGSVRRSRRIEVTIPPGVDEGQVLRVPGQGSPGPGGAPAGDLYVQILFESHEGLRREGADAFGEVTIPLADALLGSEVRVPTILSEAMLRIPAGTQPESQFRLRGEGFPRLRGRDRGDLIYTVHVEIPRSLTTAQKETLREALGAPVRGGRKGGLFGRR